MKFLQDNIYIVIDRINQRSNKAIEYWNDEKFQLNETLNRANKIISEFIYDSTKFDIEIRHDSVDYIIILKNQSINTEDIKEEIHNFKKDLIRLNKYSENIQESIYNYTIQQELINKSIEDKINLKTVNIFLYLLFSLSSFFMNLFLIFFYFSKRFKIGIESIIFGLSSMIAQTRTI